uniref:Verticillium wilt disease resistance protein Ve2 n=1 Tax=Solanum tuberosum TaxID=4113 RepID=M1D7U9_SOLTU
MTSVDLSSNRFEGDIPNSIGSLSSLVLLNLSHNSFHGHIPAEIAKLQALKALDFSWNRLIGEIPGLLSCLTVFEVLNLSYNHLAGRSSIHFQMIHIVKILIYVDFHFQRNVETIMCQMSRHLNKMMMMIHFL